MWSGPILITPITVAKARRALIGGSDIGNLLE